MRISIEYSGYNPKRYKRPWGAIVQLKWGKFYYDFSKAFYVGDDNGGKVYIDCQVNDVIATGQRGDRDDNTKHVLYIVQTDGNLQEVDTTTAFEYLVDQKGKKSASLGLGKYTDQELIGELNRRGFQVNSNLPE